MTTRRLFFALNATDPLAESFLPTLKKLKINADKKEMTMKWVPPDNFHITVTFIGDTAVSDIPKIQAALAETCKVFNSFDLKIEDMGAFSSEHEARVIWLGVQNKRYLNELKNELDRNLAERGISLPVEFREFVPHLTIGRLRNPKSVKDMISPFKRKSFGKLHVHEVVLYESHLHGNFPVYTPIYRCELTAEEKSVQEENELAVPASF